MGRCRFVQPHTVRLSLVDVHRRAHAALAARPLPTAKNPSAAEREAVEREREAALQTLRDQIAEAERDGEFVDVKGQLTAGEERELFTRQIRSQGLGERAVLDLDQVGKSKIVQYVLGWSLVDEKGAPVPFSESALDNLDIDTYGEIRDAVDFHEASVEEARATRKNGKGGERPSSAISPSPSTTAGAMSGSLSSTQTSTL